MVRQGVRPGFWAEESPRRALRRLGSRSVASPAPDPLEAIIVAQPTAGTFRLMRSDGRIDRLIGGPGAALRCLRLALAGRAGALLIRGTASAGTGLGLAAIVPGESEIELIGTRAVRVEADLVACWLADRLTPTMRSELIAAGQILIREGVIGPRFRLIEASAALLAQLGSDAVIYTTPARACLEGGPSGLLRALALAGEEGLLVSLDPVTSLTRAAHVDRPLRVHGLRPGVVKELTRREGQKLAYAVQGREDTRPLVAYAARAVAEAAASRIPGAFVVEGLLERFLR